MRRNKTEKTLLLLSAFLTVGILCVMDFWLVPQIEQHTNGLRVFDLNTFGYTFAQAKEFVSLLQPAQKHLFLTAQLPLDFLCPLCYGCFFHLSLKRLLPKKPWPVFLPLFVMLFDYLENICSLRMLTADFGKLTALLGSTCTVIKSFAMYGTFLLLAVLLVRFLCKGKRQS